MSTSPPFAHPPSPAYPGGAGRLIRVALDSDPGMFAPRILATGGIRVGIRVGPRLRVNCSTWPRITRCSVWPSVFAACRAVRTASGSRSTDNIAGQPASMAPMVKPPTPANRSTPRNRVAFGPSVEAFGLGPGRMPGAFGFLARPEVAFGVAFGCSNRRSSPSSDNGSRRRTELPRIMNPSGSQREPSGPSQRPEARG
jgi:hypothetical protein